MRRENINYIVVGIFVLIMMALLLVVLYQVTGRSGPADEYYVAYKNVTGMKYGTPVLYEGYQIGQVTQIKPIRDKNKTRYLLDLDIKKDWKIPSDSVAAVVASGLLSAITIDIKEGTSRTMLKPGDTLKGREATSIFDTINEVATDISELSKEGVRPLIDNINTHINKIGSQLTDLISDDIKPMMERLDDEVVTDLKDLFARLIVSADRLQKFLNEENQENVLQFLENVETASGSLNELLENLDGTRIVINDILGKIDHIVDENDENIHASISDLQKSLEVVSQNINSIVHNIEGSSRNINELTREVRENPSLILKSSPQPEKEEY